MPEILRKIPLQPLDSNQHYPGGCTFPQSKNQSQKEQTIPCPTKPQFPAASTSSSTASSAAPPPCAPRTSATSTIASAISAPITISPSSRTLTPSNLP